MTEAAGRGPRPATLAIYGTGIGLSAFLLFSVQPLVGRLALPVFGGVPAAWATVLAFFQGVLLLGYVYGHLSVTRLGLRRGALLHVVIAAAALALLVAAPRDWAALRSDALPPGLNLLAILFVAVGPAAFLLAATTPLLSAWYAAVRDAETPGAVDPYWLYAVSNAASLGALLAYPLVIEPVLGLGGQHLAWTVGVGAFAAVVAAAAWRVRAAAPRAPERPEAAASSGGDPSAIGAARRLRWFVLAAIPTGLLAAVTTFIATDLVSAPLLWIGPLAIYLGSFVVAFSGRGTRLVRWATVGATAAATLLWVPLGAEGAWPLVPLVAVTLAAFAAVATALHGRLAADRPPPARLTEFYAVLSAGGVTAGAFVALVAPAVFPDAWEYPLLVAMAAAAIALSGPRAPTRVRSAAGEGGDAGEPPLVDFGPLVAGAGARLAPYLVVAALLAVPILGDGGGGALATGGRWLLVGGLVLLLGGIPRFFAGSTALVLVLVVLVLPSGLVFRDRSFFGVTTVVPSVDGERLEILSGTTVHGVQYLDDERRNRPATYYAASGPVGDLFRLVRDLPGTAAGDPVDPAGRAVGVVGLGAGGLAAYAAAGDRWTFFEIDPVVVRVARDARLFTYLRDAPVRPEVVLGDGRLELERVADGTHDLLVLDAFTSDAIPAHLLTVEALRDAIRTVAPGGLLAVHVSNRYYDLGPAVAAAARDLGLACLRRIYAPTAQEAAAGAVESVWVVLARDPASIAPLEVAGWAPVPADGVAPITDDRPDVLRFLAFL